MTIQAAAPIAKTAFPLTSPQRQIWFDQMLNVGTPLYNIGGYMHLCGSLDVALFRQSAALLVAKHDVLRTVLVGENDGSGDGLPLQRHAEVLELDIPVLDFSSQADAHEAALAWMNADFQRPFALAGEPLLRYALLIVDADTTYFYGCYHHLIADGWSIALLTRSHAELYTALLAGTTPEVQAPSYRQFGENDSTYLASSAFEAQGAYWKRKFATPVEKLLSPRYFTGNDSNATKTSTRTMLSSEHLSMVLPRDWYDALGALAREQGATTFHAILAALQIYFTRVMQQDEMVVGLPVLNRGNAAFKATAGTFVGMTAARLGFDGGVSFATVLREIAAELRQDYRHQRYPIRALNDDLGTAAGDRPALFDIGLSYERHDHELAFGTAHGVAHALLNGHQATPLMLYVREFHQDQDVQIDFVYNKAYFSRGDILALQQRLRHLLDRALADPHAGIATLPVLTAGEFHQLTSGLNQTEKNYPQALPVHQQFEQQARCTPEATALVWEGQSLSYRQLNEAANRLAQCLIADGVLPDTLVAVYAERSVELVVGLLAVLKSGGAYMPLDPDYPRERLAYMLENSGVSRVLAGKAAWLASGLQQTGSTQQSAIRQLDLELQAVAGFPAHDPQVAIDAQQLAYMMYTSGSTGKPKGAGVPHGGLSNRLLWMQESYALDASDRVLQKTPFSFDVSVWEFFWPLMVGATLVVARPGDHQDPVRLAQVMERERITTMHFVPSMLLAFVESEGLRGKSALRQVFASGEALPAELQQRFLRQSSARLINLYGPTEATIDVTAWDCVDAPASSVPIGRPIANTQIYLLDDSMSPVPVGVPGALYIGGVQLARGYHARPDLTAEKFVPNPFGPAGSRLYHSGDLACWRSDGAIEYLGRSDDQVKIRGVRIELGEIEAALLAMPVVREAVVMARDDDGHGKRLVAYVVLREPVPQDEDAGALSRRFKDVLLAQLPRQYVPDHVVAIAAIPLSRNGKADRKALPAPQLAGKAGEGARNTLASATEIMLAALWSELLEAGQIGADDHFFDLGGHSLLAVRLLARLRQDAGIVLPLRTVFEAPRLRQMAEAIDIQQASALTTDTPAALPELKRADRQAPLPLSFPQQRLWFLDRLEPNGVSYNMAGGLRLTGRLDAVALESAINAVVQRHEMLRTAFDMAGDSAVQIIAPRTHVRLTVTDLSTLPLPLRQTQARQLAQNDAMLPFDLRAAPLLRVRLLVLGAREHWLVVSLHHIVADGWSLNVLMRDIAVAYNCQVSGTAMDLPPLPAQYADFAVWQRQLRQTAHWDRQLGYWRERLADAATLVLPVDHARPAARTDHGASLSFTMPGQLATRLRALGRQNDATLFMTLLGAFGVLLSRYSAQDDFCIGVPIANRQHAALDGLIGCFVNLLVIRLRFAEDPDFSSLLRQVRETALAAYANQDIAFEHLVDALRIERDLSHSPLFQVMFTLHEQGMGSGMAAPLSGLEQAPLDIKLPVAKFDLSLEMWEQDDSLAARLEYSTDLFEHATIERLAQNFERLLQAVAEHADLPVSRLDLLSGEQKATLLERFNDSHHDFPLQSSYAALFAQQVAQHPERIAAVCLDQRLSYQELDVRSNRLAVALRAAGAGPDVLVGVVGPRDLCYLAMMIAILKAGAAYVPLDTHHPVARLRDVVVRGRIPLVMVAHVPASVQQGIVGEVEHDLQVLDAARLWTEGPAPAALEPVSGPDDLAYVIFTSGSTGQPKGAMVEQRGLLNNLFGKVPALGLGAHDRVAQTASPAFDISVWQFLAAPLLGGCVHIMPDVVAHDAARLLDELAAQQVTVLQVVPNMLRQLAELPPSAAHLALRWVLSIGEALAPAAAAAWFRRFPEVALINIYGPAECADNISYQVLTDATAVEPFAELASIPVGQPTANTRLYVLDQHQQLLPIGVPGEICVAGAGVGRGYLNDAETTAKAFITHPFEAGARFYRTGDRGRLRADGVIEYLGRRDQQIKIRGQRLELGEVETRLINCEGVEEAVAVTRRDPQGELHILAYWVPREHTDPRSVDSLRRELTHDLPHYMVPSQFILLDRLPRNVNGKVDRPYLAQLPWQQEIQVFEAPATIIERRMAEIWSSLLGQGGIGRDDNFFALGGHSLLATQVVAQIGRAFAVQLPLRAMFEAPTIRELAALLENAPRTEGREERSLMPVDRSHKWPLSFAQQRLWIVDQFESNGALYNIAHAIRLNGALQADVLKAALDDIVARHEVLRTTFERIEGQPVQRIAAYARVSCVERDLTYLAPEQRVLHAQALATEEALRPFDLRDAPLLRAELLRLEANEHWLLLTVHHIAADGWSGDILARELVAFYHARINNVAPVLPVLPVQYLDYAVWQHGWQETPERERQLDYWRTQLEGVPPSLTLPVDHPRPSVSSGRGACIDIAVDSTLTSRLRALAQSTRTTLFMVLSSAYALMLGRYAAQDDVCIGTPVANRERAEVADLIGFFVNTLVLRFRLGGQSAHSFSELLDHTREMALSAYAHQDIPFEQLVQALLPNRDAAQTPLFQAMFVLQAAPVQVLPFDGLSAESLNLEPVPVARFDLTLQMTESAHGMDARFVFNADLFEPESIERFSRHFVQLLEEVVLRPTQPIAELDWMRADEKQQILADWNRTNVARNSNQTVQQLFEACVQQYGDEVAVVYEHDSLSYDELNRRANRLAHHLREQGIVADDLVCICVERSIDTLVGILGTLKAGGAYLPLDPALPAARFANVFKSARPKLLLTQERVSERLPETGAPRICLDSEALWSLDLPDTNPDLRTDPHNLAYVIYTSGTTGQPKGTLIHHGGLTNLVFAQQDAFGLAAGMNVLQWASLTFDAAVSEIFTALTTGARLYMASNDALLPGENLLRTLRRHQIALVTLTPSALAALPMANLPCLKTLVVAGERCDPAIIAPWTRKYQVINAYGPTEATVCATVHAVAGDGRRSPPIGKPIANTQTYILDANLQPVPIGVTGELYLGGDGLARGYLGQPDMTAERFIPNPHSQQAGARLYRTGDLARFLPNGTIDYIGRIDAQVKLRGYRIEPTEIAFALTELPAVGEAVVLVQKTASGDQRLVAYVVREAGHEPSATATSLRTALQAVLPGYMVPAHFVFLEALPHTRNGKLDSAALNLVPWGDESAEATGPLASTGTELQLEPLWAQLLERKVVGKEENFFELGGHSLLAVRLMARVNALFGCSMPVSQLFQSPTIALLAKAINSRSSSVQLSVQLRAGVRPEGGREKEPVWLIHPSGGTVFCYRKLATSFDPARSVYGIQSAEMAGQSGSAKTLDAMCHSYLDEVTRLQPEGIVHLAGWSLGGVVAMRMADLLEQGARQVAWVGLFDTVLYLNSPYRNFETFMVWALTTMNAQAWAQSPLDARAQQLCAAFLEQHGPEALENELRATPDFLLERMGFDVDDMAFFRQQYEVQQHHISLVAGFAPNRIKAPIHVFFALEADRALQRDSRWMSHTEASADSSETMVPGTHENLILIDQNIEIMARTLEQSACSL